VNEQDQPKVPDTSNGPQVSPEEETQEIVPRHLVRRNQVSFAIIVSLIYLAAPVFYVDVVQATLCDKLGASKAVANLPSSLYMLLTIVPVFFAWLIPYMRLVRRVIVVGYAIGAVMGAIVALVLMSPATAAAKIAVVTIHAAVLGGALGTSGVFGWEILSKGMTEVDRGKIFSITYGFGPGFAVLGSLGTHALLSENIPGLHFPYDCAMLFGLTAPVLLVMALLARRYYVPIPAQPEHRQPFVSFVFGGLWDFIRQRQFVVLLIAYLLWHASWYVFNNASLNLRDVLGVEPKLYAGWIDALRFGGKMVAGFLLGWLVARRGAKGGAMLTTLMTTTAVLWLLGARGQVYLVTFALFGAGELAGLYYPNYLVSASEPEHVKRNVSLLGLIVALPAAAIPTLHGHIADYWGFHAGFWAALAAGVLAIVLLAALPYRPPAKAPALADEQRATATTSTDD